MVSPLFDGLPDIFTDSLGEPVIYTPTSGSPVTINGIVTVDPIDVALGNNEAASDDVTKVAHLRQSDVPNLAEGDQLTVEGIAYRISTPIRPDGKGMVAMNLAKI